MIQPPEPDSRTEGSCRKELDVSADFKFRFEKLTFAISKQRLTLAGQEIAAHRDMYQRGLLV